MKLSRRRIRAVAVLPTLLTLGNLVCGFFAIVVAARVAAPAASGMVSAEDATNCMLSAWLIFLAMVFDALDGQAARLSRSASQFGAQLDSLADLVTFGVAPAFLLVKLVPDFAFLHREVVWSIAAAFAACAALRLARFNVETGEEDDHRSFSGLPTPAAGAAVASFAILFSKLRVQGVPVAYAEEIDGILQTVLPLYAVVVALLMVSRVPYPHLFNQLVRGHRSLGHVVGLVFLLAVVLAVRALALPALLAFYVLSGPVRFAWHEFHDSEAEEEPLFD